MSWSLIAVCRRADEAVAATVGQLREAVFDLHPYVLEEAGLTAALRSVAQQAARRGDLALELDLRYGDRHPREPLLFSAARELVGADTDVTPEEGSLLSEIAVRFG